MIEILFFVIGILGVINVLLYRKYLSLRCKARATLTLEFEKSIFDYAYNRGFSFCLFITGTNSSGVHLDCRDIENEWNTFVDSFFN